MSLEAEYHVIDLLPDFVLDALSDDETNQVVDHLAGCSSCQVELARLEQVADEIPLALKQTSPPPAIKSRLLRSIWAKPDDSTASTKQTFWQKLGQGLHMPLPAIGLALIVILALGNLFLWRQLQLNTLQTSVSMRVFALANTENASGAVGTLVMDPQGKYGTLVVDNLAPLAPEWQYQVWLNKGDGRISGGLFSVNYEGYASMEISAPLPLDSYDSLGISVEPAGGSLMPSGPKILGVELLK